MRETLTSLTDERILAARTYPEINALIAAADLSQVRRVVQVILADSFTPSKILLSQAISSEIGAHIHLANANLMSDAQRIENDSILEELRRISAQVSAAVDKTVSDRLQRVETPVDQVSPSGIRAHFKHFLQTVARFFQELRR